MPQSQEAAIDFLARPPSHPFKKKSLTAPRDALQKLEIAILYATLVNEAATPGKEMIIDLIHFTSFANGAENRSNIGHTMGTTPAAN